AEAACDPLLAKERSDCEAEERGRGVVTPSGRAAIAASPRLAGGRLRRITLTLRWRASTLGRRRPRLGTWES
ncbi:MAG: hypothetical protein WB508_10180, partial [Aeromicrobium sp.]|uniref:hypothetical protein n=1 Tax=Aeromicrobium sp. TaxID=1871063 RepID=UPI003C58CC1B